MPLACPTRPEGGLEIIQDIPALSNLKVTPEIETPGALAGATEGKEKAAKLRREGYPTRPRAASPVPLPGAWERARFGWLKAIRTSGLSPNAKVLACCIVHDAADRLSGACFWKRSQFAEGCGFSEDTVKRAFRALEDAGFLARAKARGRGSRRRILFTVPGDLGAPVNQFPRQQAPIGHQDEPNHPREAAEIAPFSGGGQTPERIRSDPGKGCAAAPFSVHARESERGADRREKGCSGAPPIYIIPRNIPNAREAEPQKHPASVANGAPRKPRLNLASVAHHGSDREAAWNGWLGKNGFPTLAALRVKSSDAQGTGWETPYRYPPTAHNVFEARTARLWAEWAAATMEDRHAA